MAFGELRRTPELVRSTIDKAEFLPYGRRSKPLSDKVNTMMPDETNIVDGSSLDDECAKRNFLGKSVTDAEEMFASVDNHCFTEDFMYLSDVAVRYYLPAAIKYAESDHSRGDYLFIGGLATALALRFEQRSLHADTKRLAQVYARGLI